jgi:hypothetical protein
MTTKLTAAQKKAWELIKSELALSDEERRERGIFGGVWGKPGVYNLLGDARRITRNTMWALHHAGLIEITDTWTHTPRFRLTDAGKAEMEAAKYNFSDRPVSDKQAWENLKAWSAQRAKIKLMMTDLLKR